MMLNKMINDNNRIKYEYEWPCCDIQITTAHEDTYQRLLQTQWYPGKSCHAVVLPWVFQDIAVRTNAVSDEQSEAMFVSVFISWSIDPDEYDQEPIRCPRNGLVTVGINPIEQY